MGTHQSATGRGDQLKALVIGSAFFNMLSLPALLHRAGFCVHVLTTLRSMAWVMYVAELTIAANDEELISIADKKVDYGFDLIVVADDVTLNVILSSNLSEDRKVKLLPVLRAENFEHINSKIALSALLKKAGINTPDFAVASNPDELIPQATNIGFPLLVKIDCSGGGVGVYECVDASQINALLSKPMVFPVLLQRKIPGLLFDLSAFFQNGKLVHFNFAEAINFFASAFSPSKLRRYYPLNQVDISVCEELKQLGMALGAHGFVNITCVLSSIDQKRYYIEADMRPNVWVEYPKFFNDDPADKIRHYFERRQYYQHPENAATGYAESFVLAYLPRMNNLEILLNKYNCRQDFNNYAGYPLFKWMALHRLRLFCVQFIKPYIPHIVWSHLKRLLIFVFP
jgi:hypothetical protein